MRNSLRSHNVDSSITAKTKHGEASYQRCSPTAAVIRLAYEVPATAEPLVDCSPQSLANAVKVLCEAEVQNTRAAVKEIGDMLAPQLDNEGLAPEISQRFRDHDERTWSDRGTSFSVQSSVYENEQILTGYKGVSDAALVRASINLLIDQRERSIRKLYQQILTDAIAKRDAQVLSPNGSRGRCDSPTGQAEAMCLVRSLGQPVKARERPSLNCSR